MFPVAVFAAVALSASAAGRRTSRTAGRHRVGSRVGRAASHLGDSGYQSRGSATAKH